ncbi:HTH-type transcriptional activator RhaS [Streptomyces sp. enrichment culture]|uniref:helix-turn-helix domain-containing protein n=1 Tax=Streptomyces sp. enrichment culture TaxID=1795815 RepID=UPI003F57DB61
MSSARTTAGGRRALSATRQTLPRETQHWVSPVSEAFTVCVVARGLLEVRAPDGRRPDPLVPAAMTGGSYRLPPGHTVTLWRPAPDDGPVRIIRVTVAAEVLTAVLEREPGARPFRLDSLRAVPAADPLIGPLAAALVTAQQAGAGERYASAAAGFLAAHILASPQHGAASHAPPAGPRHTRLAEAAAHMHDHLADTISMDALADLAGVSYFHFIRMFTAATGRTPHQFLTELRIQRARRLLETTEESIASIGVQCGHRNSKHFSRDAAAPHRRRGAVSAPSASAHYTVRGNCALSTILLLLVEILLPASGSTSTSGAAGTPDRRARRAHQRQ